MKRILLVALLVLSTFAVACEYGPFGPPGDNRTPEQIEADKNWRFGDPPLDHWDPMQKVPMGTILVYSDVNPGPTPPPFDRNWWKKYGDPYQKPDAPPEQGWTPPEGAWNPPAGYEEDNPDYVPGSPPPGWEPGDDTEVTHPDWTVTPGPTDKNGNPIEGDWTPPPDYTPPTDPGYPPGWEEGDPLPPGWTPTDISWTPPDGYIGPEGWQLGDPPPGWKEGDPPPIGWKPPITAELVKTNVIAELVMNARFDRFNNTKVFPDVEDVDWDDPELVLNIPLAGTQKGPIQVWLTLAAPEGAAPITEAMLQFRKAGDEEWTTAKHLQNLDWTINATKPMQLFGPDALNPPGAQEGDTYDVRMWFSNGISESADLDIDIVGDAPGEWKPHWMNQVIIGKNKVVL